jgi:DNA polymerase III subunit alpha
MSDYKFTQEMIDLFEEGRTKGIFQLDRQSNWSKKTKPSNLGELSDLIAIIRPGCTRALLDGKSMTQHYVDRKDGLEEIEYVHESLEVILKATQGVLVYQEQAMAISVELASFTLQEADVLRKAIGKKKADLMRKVRVKFENGCIITQIVTEEEANEIFSWIEKSSRYSFNKSHSMCYAANSYECAYFKAHWNVEFFCSCLEHAQASLDPHEEVRELITDAKYYDVEIKLPTIDNYSPDFRIEGDKTIYFGLNSVKSLTGVNGKKLLSAIHDMEGALGRPASEFSWTEILIFLSPLVNKKVFTSLCTMGFFSSKNIKITRNKALYDYLSFKNLNKKEVEWAQANFEKFKWSNVITMFRSLAPTKKEGGGTNTTGRKEVILNEIYVLENPPFDLQDDPMWIATEEIKLLGCPVSISKIESSDTSDANTTCKDVLNGKQGEGIYIAANITKIHNHTIKKKGKNEGKIMTFLTLEDSSGAIEAIAFPEAREAYSHLIYEDCNSLFFGAVNDSETLIIEKMYIL